MIQNVSCQPNETETFSARNIRQCQRYVRSIQRKLDLAVALDDKAKIRWYFHILSKRSRAVKVLAVNQVTRINSGKHTAGVDGIGLPKVKREGQNRFRLQQLLGIDITSKPKPIRRVYIPKPNGKRRALGIPTISDRIVQDILKTAIEPIAEYHFSNQSYGFRPKRCTQDAIEDLYKKLAKKGSRRWVVEGDVKACFDHISHVHILETLRGWHTPQWATEIISKMLKSKIFYDGVAFPAEEGTPQGGIISPLLANAALTALDDYCQKFGWTYTTPKTGKVTVNPIVRYADDFVVVCQSEHQAIHIKTEMAQFLKRQMGLDLSDEKTQITHISKGFNFLGFHLRKYRTRNLTEKRSKWEDYKLIIKPQKEKVTRFLQACKKALKPLKAAPQIVVIKRLNPKLMGWANYYRFVCSSRTFNQIDFSLWWKVYRWAKRRHTNKSNQWVMQRYLKRWGHRKNLFYDKTYDTSLFSVNSVSCSRRWVKVNREYRVYQADEAAIEYWNLREYANAKDSIYGSGTLTYLFRNQKGKCAHCNTPITEVDIQNRGIHQHHMKPRCFSGNKKLCNLRLIHKQCHTEIHDTFCREEMARYTDNGIDYLKLLKRSKSSK